MDIIAGERDHEMLILDLIEHETIWGGQRLSVDLSQKKKVGHLYSLITENEMASRIQNGVHEGRTFRDYFTSNKADLGMEEYNEFPFVVALVEASENLSIQVHPDDITAQNLENQRYGKNESWYFLEAPTDGWIYNGCVLSDKFELRQRIGEMNLEGITDKLLINVGDYVYVEAGTLHAMSRGSLVYEIEENCSLTYRFFDFNRTDAKGLSRELHIEKAFQAVDVSKKSIPKRYNDIASISERRYSTQLLTNLTSYMNTGNKIACFTLIDGCFFLEGFEIKRGTSIIVLPGEHFLCDAKMAMIARPRHILYC